MITETDKGKAQQILHQFLKLNPGMLLRSHFIGQHKSHGMPNLKEGESVVLP